MRPSLLSTKLLVSGVHKDMPWVPGQTLPLTAYGARCPARHAMAATFSTRSMRGRQLIGEAHVLPCPDVDQSTLPNLTLEDHRRVQRYLGRLSGIATAIDVIPSNSSEEKGGGVLAKDGETVRCESSRGVAWQKDVVLFGCYPRYTCDMQCLLHHVGRPSVRFAWAEGDVLSAMRVPTFAKSRPITPGGYGVLLPLNWRRHFEPLVKARKLDQEMALPFSRRKSMAVWRGASTGKSCDPTINARLQLMLRWGGARSPLVNVAFSVLVQCLGAENRPRSPRRTQWQRSTSRTDRFVGTSISRLLHMKTSNMDMRDLMQFKYIIIVEGNDVASSLPWVLSTDSVPLMAPPTIEAWLLHGDLVPWHHYVPLRPDFSDLEERVRWLESNPTEAMHIARAGREYAAPFGDPRRDVAVASEVMREYLSKVRFMH